MQVPKRMIATLAFVLGMQGSYATAVRMPLQKAILTRTVSLHAISNGGYMGKGITLALRNNARFPVELYVEPALIFKPDDTSYQNLVAVGNETIAMEAHGTSNVTLQTFCGKSYAHSPAKDLKYKFWKQGDSSLIKVVNFIQDNSTYGSLGQSAVWALTNDHSISSIYDYNQSDLSKKLGQLVAGLSKRKYHGYFTRHAISNTPGEVAFDPEVLNVYAEIEWSHRSPRNMHVYVYKENGDLYREEFSETISTAGHKVRVILDPQKDPKGVYYVQLKDDDNRIWQEQYMAIE